MGRIMDKLRIFVAQEPVVAASCLIAGVGLFLPAVVRPILDSFESSKLVPQPASSDVAPTDTQHQQHQQTPTDTMVVAGMTGKN